MHSDEIRRRFIEFFEKRGHRHVESSSLVPGNDPTLLFTNSGMVQFKDVFLGFDKRPYKRAVTAQRCLRAGGKHNDLENVGYTMRHHTFFEMLGNFSFGDYFKEKAIPFAWEFLTSAKEDGGLGIEPEHLWVTVFGGGKMFGEHSEAVPPDDEARAIWMETLQNAGFSQAEAEKRITAIPTSDNFWMMGESGPCGPCSEIFFNRDADAEEFEGEDPRKADSCVEIWNLVFMQFDRVGNGTLRPLPAPCVDTGMGLERIAAVMWQDAWSRGVPSAGVNNYEAERFIDLLESVDGLMIEKFGCESAFHDKEQREAGAILDLWRIKRAEVPYRVIADHIRAVSFLIFDGVYPLNDGRGYVLRRIIRRAVRHGYQHVGRARAKAGKPFEQFAPFLCDLVSALAEQMPQLKSKESLIRDEIRREEAQFLGTMDLGMRLLAGEIAEVARCRAILARHFAPENSWPLKPLLYGNHLVGFQVSEFRQEKLSEKEKDVFASSARFNLGPILVPMLWLDERDNPLAYAKDAVLRNLGFEAIRAVGPLPNAKVGAYTGDSGISMPRIGGGDGGRIVSEHTRSIQWARSAYALVQLGADAGELKMEMLERGFSKDDAKRFDSLVRKNPPLDYDSLLAKIDGAFAFKLYDTCGFPLDLTADIARECGLEIDQAAFDECMQAQRERSRAAMKFKVGQRVVAYDGGATEPFFYAADNSDARADECDAKIVALFVDGESRKEARPGEDALLVFDRTPFYAESGGQVGDRGIVESKTARAQIVDAQKIRADVWGHKAKIESDAMRVGDAVECRIDADRRRAIERNHSATHLLHSALRWVLGPRVEQRGSLVDEAHLRFDFSHGEAVSLDDLAEVEKIVNAQIRGNAAVETAEMPYADAVKSGATALFGEKYGDKVRVVKIDPDSDFSIELCGGTHVKRAGDIGYFHLIGEGAVAAGIRRIEAHTAAAAVAAARRFESRLQTLADSLKTPADRVEEKIESLQEALKIERRKTREFEERAAADLARALAARVEEIGGRRALVAAVDGAPAALRDLAARLRGWESESPFCVLLIARDGEKASVVAAVDAKSAAVDAREWSRAAADVLGARGGGKPDFAQAGGGDSRKIESALEAARDFLRQKSAR